MQMYEVAALEEDMQTEIQKMILYADNEEDAIDRMQEILREQGRTYAFCTASEIGDATV